MEENGPKKRGRKKIVAVEPVQEQETEKKKEVEKRNGKLLHLRQITLQKKLLIKKKQM